MKILVTQTDYKGDKWTNKEDLFDFCYNRLSESPVEPAYFLAKILVALTEKGVIEVGELEQILDPIDGKIQLLER